MGEEFEGVNDSSAFGGGYLNKITSVVVEGWTDIPPIDGVGSPGATLFWGFI